MSDVTGGPAILAGYIGEKTRPRGDTMASQCAEKPADHHRHTYSKFRTAVLLQLCVSSRPPGSLLILIVYSLCGQNIEGLDTPRVLPLRLKKSDTYSWRFLAGGASFLGKGQMRTVATVLATQGPSYPLQMPSMLLFLIPLFYFNKLYGRVLQCH